MADTKKVRPKPTKRQRQINEMAGGRKRDLAGGSSMAEVLKRQSTDSNN